MFIVPTIAEYTYYNFNVQVGIYCYKICSTTSYM